jgi:hypothetical protein
MILDEFVEIKWCSSNKNYYVDKGYGFTKVNDIFNVKIDDIPNGSHVLVHCKCDICNVQKLIAYREYNKNISNGNYFSCSIKCSKNKTINSNLKKYGVTCTLLNEKVKEKIKITNLKKYGVENISQNNEIKEKKRISCIKKYGVDSYSKTKEFKDGIKKSSLEKYGVSCTLHNKEVNKKTKKNNLIKYGVDSYSKTKEFKAKFKETSLRKYNVENPSQNIIIKKKIKETNLLRYGEKNSLENEKIKNKRKNTMIEKYGVSYAIQNSDIKKRIKATNLKRYGVEYPSQNKTISEKIKNSMIERYGEIWINYAPKYNINSIAYLDLISEKLNLPIQHALNGGEKKFVRYWVDGYIEKHNICIEWDEASHNRIKYKEKDVVKEKFLKEKFNCCVIRINEKEFLYDIDNQINVVLNKIKEIIM